MSDKVNKNRIDDQKKIKRSRFNTTNKFEKEYLERGKNLSDLTYKARDDSPVEGFERRFKLMSAGEIESSRMTFSQFLRMPLTASLYIAKIIRGVKNCYRDLDPYFTKVEKSQILGINLDLWEELNTYAKEKWDIVKIGFTELPNHLIFRNKFVLFRYALIFMMEMNKDKIDKAPKYQAGRETMRIYAELGIAVNDIARWLRKKGLQCQSNHPLRGLTLTPPLAGKAGMGWQGKQGVLITPEFGPRQRLAPIYIEQKIFNFTDSLEHRWIEQYCDQCGLCVQECPVDAIYEEKKIHISSIPRFGDLTTCIDADKCFPYFTEKFGCSICIKVCPFSGGKSIYDTLKQRVKND